MPPNKAEKIRKQFDEHFDKGFVLTDIKKNTWTLGELIGRGGFGNVYVAFPGKDNPFFGQFHTRFSAKIEPLTNGPLFSEIAFYQRVATKEKLDDWCRKNAVQFLGIPTFYSSGTSSDKSANGHRFIILPRLGMNVETVWVESGKNFQIPSVYQIGMRLLDCLKYIHSSGFSHGDIKTSNLMTGFGEDLSNCQIFLMDFGLASSFMTESHHRPYKEDLKRRHDGTVEYASPDAHAGAVVSRRGDLINLGFLLLHLIIKELPWQKRALSKDTVYIKKLSFLKNLNEFELPKSSKENKEVIYEGIKGVIQYFKVVDKLSYYETPPYSDLFKIFKESHDKYADDFLIAVNNKNNVCLTSKKTAIISKTSQKIHARKRPAMSEPEPIESEIKPMVKTPRRNPARLAKR